MNNVCDDNLNMIYDYLEHDVHRIHLAMTCRRMYHCSFRLTQVKMFYDQAMHYTLRANLQRLMVKGNVPLNFRIHFPHVKELIYTSHHFSHVHNDVLQCESIRGHNVNFSSMGNVQNIHCKIFKIKNKHFTNQPITYLQHVKKLCVASYRDKKDYPFYKLDLTSFRDTNYDIIPNLHHLVSLKTHYFKYEEAFQHLRVLKIQRCELEYFPLNLIKLNIQILSIEGNFEYLDRLQILKIGYGRCDEPNITHIQCPMHLQRLSIKQTNENVKISMYDTLKYLHIEDMGKMCIDHLPSDLRVLKLGLKMPLRCAFPHQLEYLHLKNYNHLFQFPLSKTLKVLHLNHYNKPFRFAWPVSLEKLILTRYNQPFVFPFSDNLRYLELGAYDKKINFDLPDQLHTLKLEAYNQVLKMPRHLRHLDLGQYNEHLQLPDQLLTLTLNAFNRSIHTWPSRLIKLKMIHFNQALNIPFPDTLQTLHLENYNHVFRHAWPIALTHLTLNQFNQTLTSVWPISLRALILDNYNQPFHHVWPAQLNYVQLNAFNLPWSEPWPESLHYLSMQSMQHIMNLPSQLKVLKLSSQCKISLPASVQQYELQNVKKPIKPRFDDAIEYYMY